MARREAFPPRGVNAQGERKVTGSQTAYHPWVFFLWLSVFAPVLEQVVFGQALLTVSAAFSANLESTTHPTLDTSKTKNKISS